MATYRGKKLSPLQDAALEILAKSIAPNPEEHKVDEAVSLTDLKKLSLIYLNILKHYFK